MTEALIQLVLKLEHLGGSDRKRIDPKPIHNCVASHAQAYLEL